MSRLISLFEHQSVDFQWTDRDASALERLRSETGAEVLRPVVLRGRRALQAMHHVGVVRLGQRTVQILPKMFLPTDSARERVEHAAGNLLHMLETAGQLPTYDHTLARMLGHDVDWFEVLTRQFATHLAEEWERGPVRAYRSAEEELPVLRGTWRIADQLRRPERKHVLSVTYDEFSADNPLNRLLRYVVERLWRLTGDPENRRRLGELRDWMDEVPLLPTFGREAAAAISLTRLAHRYDPLLNLAQLFLSGSSLQPAHGDVRTFAFVFDMNRLFEQFLTQTVRRHLRDVWEPRGWQPKVQATARALVQDESGRSHFRLRPDLLFCDADGETILILDMKYKQVDLAAAQAGVEEADAYQMFAYAQRYQCPRVVLMYPTSGPADRGEPMIPLVRYFATTNETSSGSDNRAWLEVRTIDLGRDLNCRAELFQFRQELRNILLGDEPGNLKRP